MKGIVWGALLGGGALAYFALTRRAEASTSEKRTGPAPLPHGGLGEIDAQGRSGASSAPAAPAETLTIPATSGPRPKVSTTAPVSAWSRRTDDGGPPLYVPDDMEALARVITSETGNGTMAERVAIGWIARNRARARRPPVSIARLVCSPCGESAGNARPLSTRAPATTQNRELAAMILASPQSEDPTQGATSCFEPALQDRFNAGGRSGHELDARGIRYCWLRGLDYFGTVGRWDLFGPKGGHGARSVPREWKLDGYAVCCYGEQRPACKGKRAGDRLEV